MIKTDALPSALCALTYFDNRKIRIGQSGESNWEAFFIDKRVFFKEEPIALKRIIYYLNYYY